VHSYEPLAGVLICGDDNVATVAHTKLDGKRRSPCYRDNLLLEGGANLPLLFRLQNGSGLLRPLDGHDVIEVADHHLLPRLVAESHSHRRIWVGEVLGRVVVVGDAFDPGALG